MIIKDKIFAHFLTEKYYAKLKLFTLNFVILTHWFIRHHRILIGYVANFRLNNFIGADTQVWSAPTCQAISRKEITIISVISTKGEILRQFPAI